MTGSPVGAGPPPTPKSTLDWAPGIATHSSQDGPEASVAGPADQHHAARSVAECPGKRLRPGVSPGYGPPKLAVLTAPSVVSEAVATGLVANAVHSVLAADGGLGDPRDPLPSDGRCRNC